MGGRGAGFGGSGSNKVVGVRVAYKNMNGYAKYMEVVPVKGSKNKLMLINHDSIHRPTKFTQKGGLKGWYNNFKNNPRYKISKITKAQEAEEKRTGVYGNQRTGIKWEDFKW